MKTKLRLLEIFLWAAAATAAGVFVWATLDRTVFQAFEQWRFERELDESHRQPRQPAPQERAKETPPEKPEPPSPPPTPPRRVLAPGDLVGRIEIPRLGLTAVIVEGTSTRCLRRAVGHIEGTSLPGEGGNTGLAGHRDTFFRALRNIRDGDQILLDTLDGTFRYVVESMRIVKPQHVEVLGATAAPALTLVTCYPFNYIGSAPKRFIVRARQVRADYRLASNPRAKASP